jgi:peptide/nickel transport system ATP-binding protein
VVAEIAGEVMVMYAGRAVEVAGRRTTFYRQHHPYTRGLLASLPAESDSGVGTGGRLRPIPGQPPSMIQLPGGCPFHPRCPYVMDRCFTEEPPLRAVGGEPGHTSACWLPAGAVGSDAHAAQVRQAAVAYDAHRSWPA